VTADANTKALIFFSVVVIIIPKTFVFSRK